MLIGTWRAEAQLASFSPLFLALIAVAMNPLLAEFPYAPTGSVVLACIAGLVALSTGVSFPVHLDAPAATLRTYLVVAMAVALWVQFFGANRRADTRWPARVARALAPLTRKADSRVLLAPVFLLMLFATYSVNTESFFVLLGTLSLLVIVGGLDWEQLIAGATGGTVLGRSEAVIAPSRLVITASELPPTGTRVELVTASKRARGVIVTRIPRPSDVWGEVHLADGVAAEALLGAGSIQVQTLGGDGDKVLGSVDVGSTERLLRFVSAENIEVGSVLEVRLPDGDRGVLYQVSAQAVEAADVRGGTQLVVRATASQVGVRDKQSSVLKRHRAVPPPGGPVQRLASLGPTLAPRATDFLLGTLLSTELPVYLDLGVATEGHLAILGMTKMGKTSLALRLAHALATTRAVVVLDQTGEWVTKRGLPAMRYKSQWLKPGLSVREPTLGTNLPKFALGFLDKTLKLAESEYRSGVPQSRVLILDEAHQFVPEPAGLGFGATGREEAIEFGNLVMQIRKYGLAIVLISQRTAVVAKSALSQCENVVAFRSVDQTGLDYLEAIAGGDSRHQLPNLRHGEALCFGPAVSAENPVVVRVQSPPAASAVAAPASAPAAAAPSAANVRPSPEGLPAEEETF